MKQFFVLCCLFFLPKSNIFAQKTFDFNQNLRQAYQKVLCLRLAEARTILKAEKNTNPDNLIIDYIENYIDFFTVFLNEDPDEFRRLEMYKDIRLARITAGTKSSPYYNYTRAEIRLQWAVTRAKFEEFFTAFREVKKALALLEQNQKEFPQFVPNKKSLGILHALVGTIPDEYKWGADILGMRGSIAQGRREIEEVLAYAQKNDFIFEEETIVMYTFMLLHLGNQAEDAWQNIQNNPKLSCATNPLACFVQANVAFRTAHTDQAINILQNAPKGKEYQPFHYLDFLLGVCKLYKGDADARQYLERYVKNFHGQNYIKEAYQKLAWAALLRGDAKGYADNLAGCRSKGSAVTEEDKKALRDANSGIIPNLILLRARLLFDGGYYEAADKILIGKKTTDFTTTAYQLEYGYRMGRIQHKLNNTAKAITYYDQTITQGKKETYYFACNAALQMGLLYEEQKQYAKARQYLNICLSLSPSEYKNSLHQKAKTILDRIKNKKG
jgi:hypothetical protein